MTPRRPRVEKVAVHFGGLVALSDMNFAVGEGEIVSLIGPNGAGKTTAFNVVTGFLNPTRGASAIAEPRSTVKPHQIAGLGLARTFQRTTCFRTHGHENLLIGLHRQGRVDLVEAHSRAPARGLPSGACGTRWRTGRMGRPRRRAHDLAGRFLGEQRLVGVALALAAEPSMLLLDEPVSGMKARKPTPSCSWSATSGIAASPSC